MNNQTIYVDSTTNGKKFYSISPTTITLNTSAFNGLGKLWKIVYNFGNNEVKTQNFTINAPYLSSLPIPDESGDPRNYPVHSNYYFDDSFTKTYTIKIDFYSIGIDIPETVSFDLMLRLPNIDEIFSTESELKLVGTRMFGTDNKILYIFESQSPNYLLPVIMKF